MFTIIQEFTEKYCGFRGSLFSIHPLSGCERLLPDQSGQINDVIKICESIKETAPRLLRGGSFGNHPPYVRSAIRDRHQPSDRAIDIGFRPARTWQQDVHPVPPEFESGLISWSVQPSPGRRPVPGDLGCSDE